MYVHIHTYIHLNIKHHNTITSITVVCVNMWGCRSQMKTPCMNSPKDDLRSGLKSDGRPAHVARTYRPIKQNK